MLSNLPPGCSESDIPGCRPEDLAIERAIEAKQCEACRHYGTDDDVQPCECCISSLYFETETDEALIGERLEAAEEARKDGHKE